MNNLKRAKKILNAGDNTCVLCRGEIIYKSAVKGISPMLDFILSGIDLKGFSAADKIVGKAAAMLFAQAEIKEVYAEVLSKSAVEILEKYNIEYAYCEMVDVIVNRTGTGICPMEEAVANIDDLQSAYIALSQKRQSLKTKKEPV